MKRHLLAACLFGVIPVVLSAQTVRGVVVDQLDRPLSGVVLQLIDSTSAIAARALTSERGEFRLTASTNGVYRVRSTRIGFRPLLSPPFSLRAGADRTERLVLNSIPVSLDAIRTTVRTACRAQGLDSTAATFAVWEQVRAALTATELTSDSGKFNTTTLGYERKLSLEGTTLRETGSVTRAPVTQPWHSISPESLHAVGYVVMESDGTTRVFHGPDLRVLLSPVFADDHCFHLTDSADDSTQIGVAFEPVPQRRNMPEIKGTLWLDRASSELRRLQYQYLNIAKNVDETETAGLMDFARMGSGAWVIQRWSIRMPYVEMAIADRQEVVQFRGMKLAGGELLSATSLNDRDTLWSSPRISIHGAAFDSLNMRPLAGALVGIAGSTRSAITDSMGRFTFDSVPPGAYRLITQHDVLESIGVSAQATVAIVATAADTVRSYVPSFATIWRVACGSRLPGPDTSLVYGTVRGLGRPLPIAGATVVASWIDLVSTGKRTFTNKRWRLDAVADSTGTYALCGVPMQNGLRLRAVTDSAESGLIDLQPAGTRLVQRHDLVISFDPNARGVVKGMVTGKSGLPMKDARVVAEGVKEVRTDTAGQFVLPAVPLGTQQIEVLAIGLQPVTSVVEVLPLDTAHVQVQLVKPVTLARVNIVASSVRQQFVAEFKARRDIGLGIFRDSTEVGAHGTLSSVFMQIPSVIVDKNTVRLPSSMATGAGCLAHIWIDGVKMEQDDLLALRPSDIAAMEVYSRELMTPAQFLTRNSRTPQCGSIVLWTKWYWEGNKNTKPPA